MSNWGPYDQQPGDDPGIVPGGEPPLEPTLPIPSVPVGAQPPPGVPPGPPPGGTYPPGPPEPPEPWYENRAALWTVVGLVAALLFLLVAFLIWMSRSDDESLPPPTGISTSTSSSSSTSSSTSSLPDSTSTSSSSTSTSTSSTTVPPTTEASTTTTTEATTTTTEATTTTTEAPATTTTTVPAVTVPPQPSATLWDVIVASPDLSELRDLILLADLDDELDDPDGVYTLFAPSNPAIQTLDNAVGGPDLTDPSVVEPILLTHVHDGDAYSAAAIGRMSQVTVVVGGPHPVDSSQSPPTVGGGRLLVIDVETANGVLHVIDTVLAP